MSPARRLRLLGAILALALGASACRGRPELSPDKAYPESSADVATLRGQGVSWSNKEVRALYLKRLATIAPSNEQWKRDGLSPEERARRAFSIRHDARLLTRSMMSDAAEVEALRARDRATYGTPDGPTFDWLVDHERQKGKTGDAAFEAIVASAQQTDRTVNEMLGF